MQNNTNTQQPTTQEKLQFVLNWLADTYKSECNGAPIPDFEQTERNISVLYELALHNIQQKKLFELKNNMMQQQMDQFRQKTSKLQHMLKQCSLNVTLLQQQQQQQLLHQTHLNSTNRSVPSSPALFNNHYNSPGINLTNMSSSTVNSTTSASALSAMRVLAELAVILDLKDTKTASYMMAINDLMNNLDTVKQERMDIHQSSEELQARILSMIERIQKLEQMNEKMENIIAQHSKQDAIQARMMNVEYLKRKVVDYDSEITRLRQKLESALQTGEQGVDLDAELPRISQSAIMNLASELSTLKEKIEPKYQKLKTYQNLPPDMQAVRLKIAEARNELVRLDSLFQERAHNIWID